MLCGTYSLPCDMWSIGVICYVLLCGYPPFYGDDDKDIFRRIKIGRFDFPAEQWGSISRLAKDFVTQLLQYDPSKRPTATEALKHSWICRACAAARASGRDVCDEEDAASMQAQLDEVSRAPTRARAAAAAAAVPLGAAMKLTHVKRPLPLSPIPSSSRAQVGARMQRYLGMSKLKKLALQELARGLTGKELKGLEKVFEAIDTSHTGELTLAELRAALADSLRHVPDPAARIDAIMDDLDADGDRRINYREFLAATMRRSEFMRERNIERVFDHFDHDKTRTITVNNLVAIMGSREHAAEVIAEADLTKDGVISYDEFKQLMKQDEPMPLTSAQARRSSNREVGAPAS